MSLSVLIDALDVLPTTSLLLPSSFSVSSSSESHETFSKFLLANLFQNVSKNELKDDCLYGLGVCAQHDNASFTPLINEAILLLNSCLGKSSKF